MDALSFAVLAFATWYGANMLVLEEGPFRIFERLREVTTFGGILECTVCCSFWVALVLFVCTFRRVDVIAVLAIAGGAVLLDKFNRG